MALTPLRPEYNAELVEKHGLPFPLLWDQGNAYAAQLGLRFALPDQLRKIYAEVGKIDLPAFNGDESWTLPMPARLVADAGGIVRAVDADPDYTRRPEPSKTLADVESLG